MQPRRPATAVLVARRGHPLMDSTVFLASKQRETKNVFAENFIEFARYIYLLILHTWIILLDNAFQACSFWCPQVLWRPRPSDFDRSTEIRQRLLPGYMLNFLYRSSIQQNSARMMSHSLARVAVGASRDLTVKHLALRSRKFLCAIPMQSILTGRYAGFLIVA
jgi:hypothetical protein